MLWRIPVLLILAGISSYFNFIHGQYILGVITDLIIGAFVVFILMVRRREIAARKELRRKR